MLQSMGSQRVGHDWATRRGEGTEGKGEMGRTESSYFTNVLPLLPPASLLENLLLLISSLEFGSKILNTRLEHPSPPWTAGPCPGRQPVRLGVLNCIFKIPRKAPGIVSRSCWPGWCFTAELSNNAIYCTRKITARRCGRPCPGLLKLHLFWNATRLQSEADHNIHGTDGRCLLDKLLIFDVC